MFNRIAVPIVAAVLSAAALASAAPADDPNFEVVDDFACTDAAARAAWVPMSGSEPVSAVTIDGRRGLKMRCNFRGTTIDRASWDRKIALDLSSRKGVRFLIRCVDPSPVSGFVMYLRSGEGWYRAHFFPAPSTGWQPVRILKSATGIEGKPAGWGKVDTLRLSAWRGQNADTEFHIAELGVFGSGGRIAILRNDSAANAGQGEDRGIQTYTDVMSDFLDSAGLTHTVLGDADVSAEALARIKLVILPYNPRVPPAGVEALAAWLKSGGRLIACYTLPGPLQPLAGIRAGRHVSQKHKGYFASIRASAEPLAGAPPVVGQASWNVHEAAPLAGKGRVAAWWFTDAGESTSLPAIVVSDNCVYLSHVLMPDDRARKQQLLLAMVGQLAPGMWKTAAEAHIAKVGRFEPYDGYDAAAGGIGKQAAGRREALDALATAAGLRKRAGELASNGKFAEAIAAAGQAHAALLDAHCLAQRPQAGEHRAFWCHSAFGVAGMSWDEAIQRLAANGFTAILPNMLWGGVGFYESEVLPVSPDIAERGDQIALCLAACRKHGIQCHIWKVNYNMGSRTSADFARRMKDAGRTQVSFGGQSNDRWLCPSHGDNQKLEIDSMVEVARKYAVDGVHFDYIRYPGPDGCFCDGCRQRFEQALGRKVAHWPADTRNDAEVRAAWLDFRRRQITAVVAAVAERARKVRPGVKISAAVFRSWPADRDSIGQDWKVWCDRGWLDFVCPMDYTPSNGQFASVVAAQLGWTGKVPCYPGIGLSTWADPTDVAKLIEQVGIARRLGTGGFTIFQYDASSAAEVLPLLGKGLTRKP